MILGIIGLTLYNPNVIRQTLKSSRWRLKPFLYLNVKNLLKEGYINNYRL